MIKLDPNDYEYLWTDHDVNYIFTSCYLFKQFRQSDIVLIYDWKSKGLRFYLSKKDWRKYSEFGVTFYASHFKDWERRIKKNIIRGEKLIESTKREAGIISEMPDEDIKKRILERAELFQDLADDYFYTESFFLAEVEKLVTGRGTGNLSRNLGLMGKLKFKAREVLNNFYNYKIIFGLYVEEIAKRKKRHDLEWLSFSEIADLIDGEKVPVSRRDKVYWVLAKKSNWKPIEGKRAKLLLDRFDNHFFGMEKNEIVGQPANRGYFKGRAKVVRTVFSDKFAKEIAKVNRGDILVAETTGPEMMLACEKAAAIITDEGGLTSHAAIVGRELGIPCIVGTKVATKIFKDGDLIEVDANKGIVRRVK